MPYNKSVYELLSQKHGEGSFSLGTQSKIAEEKDILNGKSFWEKTRKTAGIFNPNTATLPKNTQILLDFLEKQGSKKKNADMLKDSLISQWDQVLGENISQYAPKVGALLSLIAKQASQAQPR